MYLFIVTTLVGFLGVQSSAVSNVVLKLLNRTTSKERSLLDERNALKREQSTLSNVRDFVQYSKLQRKINAVEQKLVESNAGRKTGALFTNLAVTYTFKVALGLVAVFLSFWYRKVPVFVVDAKYSLYPFGEIVSFPNDEANAVSVHFWMICCTSVARLFVKK